VICRR